MKVNPLVSGMPTSVVDRGYSSYEKSLSDEAHGSLPKRITPSRDLKRVLVPKMATETNKMAIRIAHGFATKVINKLVDNISECKESGLTDVQAYNKIFEDYGDFCSDYIIKSLDTAVLRIENKEAFVYSNVVRGSELAHAQLSIAPIIIQDYLYPKTDIRVTVIGDSVFAVKILLNGIIISLILSWISSNSPSLISHDPKKLSSFCPFTCMASLLNNSEKLSSFFLSNFKML